MNTVIFLSSPGRRQRLAYDMLEDLWNRKYITELYKHTSNKRYKRYPDEYDLGINFLYPYDIPSSEIVKTQWINFHIGPLPEYGGHNTAYHAIMDGAECFGASVHYMELSKFEAGLIETTKFMIEPYHNANDLIQKAQDQLILLFLKLAPILVSQQRGLIHGVENIRITYHEQHNLDHNIKMNTEQQKQIRALTHKQNPTTNIHDVTYSIKKEK